MKDSECRDPRMAAYYREVRRLEDKSNGLELNHVLQRDNEAADALIKMALGRMTIPCFFVTNLFVPTVRYGETHREDRQISGVNLLTLESVAVIEGGDPSTGSESN
jgi:hypothetical protein